jgi:hypothetical protein
MKEVSTRLSQCSRYDRGIHGGEKHKAKPGIRYSRDTRQCNVALTRSRGITMVMAEGTLRSRRLDIEGRGR